MTYTVPNYNEQSAKDIPGTTYRRVRYIGIWNPTTGPAQIQILEADALFINGAKRNLDEGVGGITLSLENTDAATLNAPIQLKNPVSDEVIEGQTFTRAQLWAMLYSWAREEQTARDQKLAPTATQPGE